MDIHLFAEEELTAAKKLVFTEYIGDPARCQSTLPIGILLGGQPAAGKTGLIRQIRRQRSDVKFVVINGDEYRQYHPRFRALNEQYGPDAPKYTQPFSNARVEYLKAECLRLRCNFIIEGTMRSYVVIENTAGEVRRAGFRCEAHALAVHRQSSLLGIFQRYESDKQRTGVGRFSPIQVHDEAYRQLPHNLDRAARQHLVDRVVVYTRRPDGQLDVGLDRADNAVESVDFPAEFDRLRVPLFDSPFYPQQWASLRQLAQQRAETDADYLVQPDQFVALSGQS